MTSEFMNGIASRHGLDYNGDNSEFVCDLIPLLKLSDADKKTMLNAYGRAGESKSYEMESDGETIVKDMFLDGVIKSPGGVTHDYVNRVPDHRTPDGHIWTRGECNALYLRIMKALGYGPARRWRRYLSVCVSGWVPFFSWWR